jgi:uncharacterized membrane protein YphA (DoxX/SURF4 family)
MEVEMLARQIAIGFGIAIIFPLLVYYGISTIHPAPKTPGFATVLANATPEERKITADEQRQRQETYRDAAKDFARVLVIASTPLGIAAILIGAYLSFQAVGTGLIFGGIFAISWGYWSYWSYLDDWIRFISLLAGFTILIFVGIRRTSRTNVANTP